jgi:hypothetical protein
VRKGAERLRGTARVDWFTTVVQARKRMGIEPTKPLLAQSFIGFEDRAAHQSQTRFRRRTY